jgi:carboxymethylenebutenolidase
LDEASVDHDIVRYPGVGHGFHCDERPSYDAAAAQDGWRRTLEWLGRHLR